MTKNPRGAGFFLASMAALTEFIQDGIRYVPTKAIAKSVGLSPRYLADFCRDGRVTAIFHKGAWYVEESSLRSFLADRQREQEVYKLVTNSKQKRRRANPHHYPLMRTLPPVAQQCRRLKNPRSRWTNRTPRPKNLSRQSSTRCPYRNQQKTTLYHHQQKPFDQSLGLVEVRKGSLSTLQRDAMSSMVVIRCPHTDEEVATGLVMDLVSFSHLVLNSAELRCPACSNTHAWSKNDAWLSITGAVRYSPRTNVTGRAGH